jgi:hypothetical protein
MTPSVFRNTSPEPGQITLLRNDLNEVTAINIHRTDCSFTSYDSSLGKLTGLTLNLTSDIIVVVNNVTRLGSYYHLTIDPIEILDEVNEEVCFGVKLDPTDELVSIDFRNSNFNPIFNNVPEVLTGAAQAALFSNKENTRRGKSIQDVDRKNDTIVPTNIQQLLSGSANLAEFPLSNYSSLANTTGRYLGSKTSVQDYGVEPIVGASEFMGSVYGKDVTNSTICSQLSEDRVVETLLFAPDVRTPNVSSVDTPEVRLQQIMSKTISEYESFTTSSTEIVIYQDVKAEKGDILRTFNTTAPFGSEELLLLKNITKTYNGASVTSSLEVDRDYYGTYTSGNTYLERTSGSDTLHLMRAVGDTIYSTQSSKLYRVTGKKLWIQETNEVFVVDLRGKVIYKEITCST